MPAAGKGGGRRAAKSSSSKSGAAKSGSTKTGAKRSAPARARTTKAPARSAKRSSARGTTATKPKKAVKKSAKQPVKKPAKKVVKKTTKKVVKKTGPIAKKASPAAKTAKAATKVTKPATKAAPVSKASVLEKKAAPAKKGGKKTVICELSGFEVTPGTPNLSPKTLERLKARLLDERERLLRQADDFAAEAEQLAREREGGDTQFDEESGEGDTVNVERERDLLLSASARQEVEDIEKALARMRRGTYGVCRYAGRRLPVERLEVRPWADVCVDCKARAERRR